MANDGWSWVELDGVGWCWMMVEVDCVRSGRERSADIDLSFETYVLAELTGH